MFFIIALSLAILCLLITITGGIIILIQSGETETRRGREVGAEIMGGITQADEEDDSGGVPLVEGERSFFVGTGVSVQRNATVDFADLKRQIAEQGLRSALPAVMAIGGFLGLMFFVGLTVLFAAPGLPGLVVALTLFYVLVRIARDFLRA